MTNKILKTHLKKIIKSEAFVSVIIVFVLAIGIIGTSYALYMDIDTDIDYQLVEVGDLSVGFDNGDSTFTLDYLTPTDDDIAIGKVESTIASEISTKNLFSFYIYNNGTYTANYNIKLVPQEGSISSEYLRYQICKDNKDNCKDIKTLNEVENNIVFTDELSPNRTSDATNPSAYYFLRVWIKSDYEPQENDKVVLKVEIDAKNASGYLDNDNTLAGKLLSDERVKINNTIPDFSTIADYVTTGDSSSGELGLFKAEDDYGISYYYRGAQSHNYVNFAGMCWRIVRINGDGSIKIILEDQKEQCNDVTGKDLNSNGTYFTGNWSDGSEIVFGYDSNGKADFLNYSGGLADSLRNFQISSLSNVLDKLKVEEWCYDNIMNDDVYYEAYIRLENNNNPSFKCSGTKLTKYKDNTDMYVGTITADELVYAGSDSNNITNYNYYLMNNYTKNNNIYWWTLTPRYNVEDYPMGIYGLYDFAYSVYNNGSLSYFNVQNEFAFRPVINLKADVLYKTGDGTSETPYEIK